MLFMQVCAALAGHTAHVLKTHVYDSGMPQGALCIRYQVASEKIYAACYLLQNGYTATSVFSFSERTLTRGLTTGLLRTN